MRAAVGALRRSAFSPPPPATLPLGDRATVARALATRPQAALEALAASIVALPSPTTHPAEALATLELFLLLPAERARAKALLAQLPPDLPERAPIALRLAALDLIDAHGRGSTFDAAALLSALDAAATAALPSAPDEAPTADPVNELAALEAASPLQTHPTPSTPPSTPHPARFLASLALDALARHDALPFGASWLTPLADGSDVLGLPEALARRPALRTELGPIANWLAPAPLQPPPVSGLHAALPHPTLAPLLPTPLPHAGLGEQLAPDAAPSPEFLEFIGDLPAAAQSAWHLVQATGGFDLTTATTAVRLAHALPPAERAALLTFLAAAPGLDDELALGRDPTLRRRAELLAQLTDDPWGRVRLAATAPAPTSTAPRAPAPGPHDPLQRLAAASDLLAAGEDEAAAKILAALLRRSDAADAVSPDLPKRLFAIVCQALEADTPPDELLTAAERTLTDPDRAVALLDALGAAPSAAFALHAPLIRLARDPSRPDLHRILALTAWLHIWRASDAAPDPAALGSLRTDEPALPAIAAVRLGHPPAPLATLRALVAWVPPTPDAWAAALLTLSQGRVPVTT